MINNNDLLTLSGEHAQHVLVDLKLGELLPTWVLVTPQNKLMIFSTPWRDQLEKDNAHIFIKRKMREVNAVAYSFIAEAWTAVYDKDFDPNTMDKMDLPRHRPDRREIVLAEASDGTETLYRHWRIQRDYKNEIFRLELQPAKDWSYSGTPKMFER